MAKYEMSDAAHKRITFALRQRLLTEPFRSPYDSLVEVLREQNFARPRSAVEKWMRKTQYAETDNHTADLELLASVAISINREHLRIRDAFYNAANSLKALVDEVSEDDEN